MTVGDFDGGTLGFELLGNGLHIGHVGAEKYRFAGPRRFENIMAADIDQTAADKSDIAHSKKFTELADRIEKQNVLFK